MKNLSPILLNSEGFMVCKMTGLISQSSLLKIIAKQAGVEVGQAQVKLEVIVKIGVEDRCIYFILRGF